MFSGKPQQIAFIVFGGGFIVFGAVVVLRLYAKTLLVVVVAVAVVVAEVHDWLENMVEVSTFLFICL